MTVIGRGEQVSDERMNVSYSAQLEPGKVKAGAGWIKRGSNIHNIDVGLWHSTGMGMSPRYGARYTYEWMPLSEAKGRRPEIVGQ